MDAGTELITIPYAPRRQFLPLHNRTQRFAAIVAHRRAGKTVAEINDKIKSALTCPLPNPRVGYIAPYYNQAKTIAWQYLLDYTRCIPGVRTNATELRVDFPNGGQVRLFGADNPDALRGAYFDDVTLDEPADMNPRLFPEVVRPMLVDRQGRASFIGTPKGRNYFFDICEIAKSHPDWLFLMLKASESGLIPQKELDDARQMMTPEQYEQEFECSFDAAILGAYYGKEMADAEREGRILEVPYDPGLPVYTAWDLGMRDSTAIWFYQIAPNEIRFIDYYENHTQPLGHYVSVLNSREYKYAEDFVPHDAKVKELGTGKTRIETLIGLKRNPRLVPDHKILDGINAARVLFKRMKFDKSKCADGIEALRQYKADFDEDRNTFRKEPRHDWTSHSADAFRYAAIAYTEQVAPKEKPKGKTLQEMTLNDLWAAQKKRKERI
jgi:phage terminase large subunit